jgi:hypothetical protein
MNNTNSSAALQHLLCSARTFNSNKNNKQRKTNETEQTVTPPKPAAVTSLELRSVVPALK